MKTSKNLVAWAASALALCFMGMGCELIASVDHSLIEGQGGGTSSTTGTGGNGGHGGNGGNGGNGGSGGGGCTDASMCPDPEPNNECVEAACTAGVCGSANVADGTATIDQTNGDCLQIQCDGNGGTKTAPDDNDIDDDNNPCTADTCNAGSPVHDPEALLTACTTAQVANGVCDGNGACVECVDENQCADKVCDQNVCVPGTCMDTVKNVNETDIDCGGSDCNKCDDLLACAVDGDCKSDVCTGMQCQVPTCSDGHKNGGETATDCGAACGAGGLCDDNLACVDGGDCKSGVCLGSLCQASNCNDNTMNGDETDVDCGGSCPGDCAVNEGCALPADCITNYCPSTTCQMCQQDGDCAGSEYCSNGTCLPDLVVGTTCSRNAECVGNSCLDGVCCGSASCTTCQSCGLAGSLGTCSNIANGQQDNVPANTCTGSSQCDGTGNCKLVNGQTCSASGQCLSGSCVDGVCCGSASCGACQSCGLAGSLGTCTNIPANQADNNPANTCTGTSSCDGFGNCKAQNGQACANGSTCLSNLCVDGVCCGSACNTTCQSCAVAGSLGTCTNLPLGQQDSFPANACTGNNQCDGAGNCKLVNGQSCTLGTQCITGNCVDGTCCGSSSCGSCQSCGLAGSLGSCANIPSGQQDNNPANTCVGNNSCNGSGACKANNGQACTLASQCLSGNCVDGFCCGSASCASCQSCGVAGSLGSCANIASGQQDNNPANTCVGNNSCNGSGACLANNGQACTLAAQCLSGNCVDGFCCGSASCASCQSCGVVGSLGSCASIPQGQTDTNPANTCVGNNACNGSGACLLAAGQPCPNGNSDCASGVCTAAVCQ